jgi:serine/threonine protein kinase
MARAYQILGRLGSGGMAEVYLAKTKGVAGFEKKVAIKIILSNYVSNPQLTAMLIDEARIATRLNHANIVQVQDLGRTGERYYIVMEYVEGSNLARIIERATEKQEILPVNLACYVCRQILSALIFVHERKDENGRPLCLVHRDISPPNVLISKAGEVKLADFGIAKANSSTIETEAGVIRGKASYMSPEQVCSKQLDARSDLFALGIVFHELLTGCSLFSAGSQMEIMEQVRQAKIPPPSKQNSQVPTALDEVVLKALAQDPQDRYASARKFDQALDEVVRSANLHASAIELESWLKNTMPPLELDTSPKPGEVLEFESSLDELPSGTQPLIEAIEPKKERSKSSLLWAIISLGLGILIVVMVLLFSGKPKTDPEPKAIKPETTKVVAPKPVPPVVIEKKEEEKPKKKLKVSVGQGVLFINSDPWARVIVDGKNTGITTPTVDGIKLKAGKHKITLINPKLELSYSFKIDIKKDEEIKRFFDLRKVGTQH